MLQFTHHQTTNQGQPPYSKMARTRFQRAHYAHFAAGGAVDLYNQGVISADDLKASADLLKALKAEVARNKAARIVEAEAALAATA
jgi:hypothetical protein